MDQDIRSYIITKKGEKRVQELSEWVLDVKSVLSFCVKQFVRFSSRKEGSVFSIILES